MDINIVGFNGEPLTVAVDYISRPSYGNLTRVYNKDGNKMLVGDLTAHPLTIRASEEVFSKLRSMSPFNIVFIKDNLTFQVNNVWELVQHEDVKGSRDYYFETSHVTEVFKG